jgi:hypothetical protein
MLVEQLRWMLPWLKLTCGKGKFAFFFFFTVFELMNVCLGYYWDCKWSL